jgi:hypothetical protein
MVLIVRNQIVMGEQVLGVVETTIGVSGLF